MKIIRRIKLKFYRFVYSIKRKSYSEDRALIEAFHKFPSRNDVYAYMHHYFLYVLPKKINKHRAYFKTKRRGFGEDAFHSMWYLLFRQFKPKLTLEIGVYRGQVISLWGLISKILDLKIEIYGISPFTSAGDKVSSYLDKVDYMEDTLKNIKFFKLKKPILIKGYSTDKKMISFIASKKWDLIYIDGGHDYETVLSDYLVSKRSLVKNGILILDDSSLYSDFTPPPFAFKGHPGPSKVVTELALKSKQLRFLGAVGHNNIFVKK